MRDQREQYLPGEMVGRWWGKGERECVWVEGKNRERNSNRSPRLMTISKE